MADHVVVKCNWSDRLCSNRKQSTLLMFLVTTASSMARVIISISDFVCISVGLLVSTL